MRTEPTTIKHRVGKCPACHGYLWAEVTLTVKVGAPMLDADGGATVLASPEFEGMTLRHECHRDEHRAWVTSP